MTLAQMKGFTMIFAIYGFFCGFIIPYVARRLAKICPASPSEVLWRLIIPSKHQGLKQYVQNEKYKTLAYGYWWRSVVYGMVNSVLFCAASTTFMPLGLGGILALFWALMLLAEIDYRTYLLPDVITVPLLIGGFFFSCYYGSWIIGIESAVGAIAGYILPVFAGVLIAWKHSDAFGGGDVKLLAAVGAWLGILPVIYTILLSCCLFAVFAFVMKRRAGAFGPAISIAAIMVAFYFF